MLTVAKTVRERPVRAAVLLASGMAVSMLAFLCAGPTFAQATGSVPAVVVSSTTTVSSTGLSSPGKVVRDTCGNLYEADGSGSILEIPASGGAPVNIGSGGGGEGLGIDSQNNIYYSPLYSTHVEEVPSVDCVPQVSSTISVATNFGNLSSPIYYYDPADVAIDAAGDLFIADGNSGEILEESASGTPSVLTPAGFFNVYSPTYLAIDAAGDLLLTDGADLYEVAAGTNFGTKIDAGLGLNSPKGVSLDGAGNLYIVDSGNSRVTEVPNSGTPQAPKFVASNAFTVLNASPGGSAGTDPMGNLYYGVEAYLPPTYSGTGVVYKVAFGTGDFGGVPIDQTSGTQSLTFLFDAATTPSNIDFVSGASTAGPFSNAGGGSCAAGTAYTAGQSCTVNLAYTPSTAGAQTGAVVLADANGNALSTGFVSGVGEAAGLTIDPGTLTPIGSGLKTPEGIAVDTAGNVYVADAGNNAVIEFPFEGGAAVSIGTGLSGPQGVAVDPAGNVFIADTGNNRVVEVPLVNGALSNAAQIVVQSGLKSPADVLLDASGYLYIVDSGDNTVVRLLNLGGIFSPGPVTNIGSQLNDPLSAAVDNSGNLYIADSGNNQVVELPFGSTGQEVVAVGLSSPSSLALDASGSLFVADKGNARILRIPNESGTLNPNDTIEVGSGIAAPYGVAVDGAGNLYVTDNTNAAAYQVARMQGVLAFNNWNLGTTSAALAASVENSGNQTLTFSTPLYTASGNTGDFSVQSPADACAASGTVNAGLSCEIAATFTPTVLGARAETLTLGSNAANAAAPAVMLTGMGVQGATTTTTLAITSPASGSPYFGEPITITATVAPSIGSGVSTGTVTFLVDGKQQPTSNLNDMGVATLSLNDGLSGGSHTVTATYSGDSTYAGSSAQPLQITVTLAPTTTVLAVTTPYINPYSALSGGTVIFSPTVSSPGLGIPTGNMQFLDGTTVLATLPVAPESGGKFGATYSTSALAAGAHSISVVYSGDANYLASTSPSAQVTIVAGPTLVVTPASGSLSAIAGVPTSLGVILTSLGGWTGVVSLQCSNLPAYTTCTTVPGEPIVYAGTSANQLKPTGVGLVFNTNVPPTTPTVSLIFGSSGGLLAIGLLGSLRRPGKKGAKRHFSLCLGLALLMCGAFGGMTACGSSGVSKFQTPGATTPVTVTVTAAQFVPGSSTQGTQAPDPVQTFTVNLTVAQP